MSCPVKLSSSEDRNDCPGLSWDYSVSIHLTKGFLNKPGTGESLCGWEGSS